MTTVYSMLTTVLNSNNRYNTVYMDSLPVYELYALIDLLESGSFASYGMELLEYHIEVAKEVMRLELQQGV